MDSQAKDILAMLIKKTAAKHKVDYKEVGLVFQLTSPSTYRCSYNGAEVSVGDAGGIAKLFGSAIKGFIVRALNNQAAKNKIPLSTVNVLMKMQGDKDFILYVRDKASVINNIDINDLLKS